MNRTRIALAALVLCLSITGIAIRAARAQAPAQSTPAPKKADEQFKNIQVLKGIPAEQVIPSMQFITASLGVECDFCHVQGAFEKDDKQAKKTARSMMTMMFAINKDNFDGHREVTCNTCHRGSTDPVSTPALATDESKETPKAESTETTSITSDQLFDKYLQAVGGAAALDKVTSRASKGTIDVGGKPVPIDLYSKAPNKRASIMHLPEGDNVTAFDGQAGWLGAPGRPVREMHGPDLDGASIDADLRFPEHLKQMFTESEVRGTEKIGDKTAYEVVGRREGKPPIRLYFDQQSGLLLRLVRYADTALGRLPTQLDYADYRDVDGLKLPFRWTLARPSGRFTIQATDVKQNVPVEDARFAKPAEVAAPK